MKGDSSLFHRNDIDVVILNQATPVLAYEVVRDGKVLFESQPGTQVNCETAAIHRYVDTKPLRRLQDRRLLERVKNYRRTP